MVNYLGINIIFIGIILSLFFGVIAQYYRNSFNPLRSSYKKNKIGYSFLILSCIALWSVPAFRYNVGIDNENYQSTYESIRQLSDIASLSEPGYGLINYLCYILFDDYQAVLFITSFITGTLLWKVSYRDADSLFIFILGILSVNLYFMSFTVIRQFLAIAILMLSIPAIEQRNIKHFLIIVGLAFSFHYTSVVFILLYILYNNDAELLSFKNILIYIVLCAILIYWKEITNLFFPFLVLLKDNYADYEDASAVKFVIEVIFLLPILLYAIVFRQKLLKLNPRNNLYILMVFFMVLTKSIGIINPTFSRLHYYFVFATPILLSYAPKLLPRGFNFILVGAIVFYLVWGITNIFEYQWEDFLPYQTIFNK